MYKYLVRLFFFSSTMDKVSLLKLFFLRIVLLPLYFIFLCFAYIVLLFNYQLFLKINNWVLNFSLIFDYLVQDRLNNIEINLKQIFFYKGSKSEIKKLSKESLRRRYYDSLVFNKVFLFLIRRKRFLNISLSMKLNNSSGVNLPYSDTRKIIFCHMHNNDKISSIVKIESMICSKLTTLYIQRAHSEVLTRFIKDVNKLLKKKEVYTYDPFIKNNTKIEFFKKIKEANIIHIYVDLTRYLAFKNFTTTKINFLGKDTFFIDGFARIAIATKAICIPVFVNGNEINLLESIDTLNLTQENKVQELMQNIYDRLSIMLLKYPEKWGYLEEAETYFRNIEFKD